MVKLLMWTKAKIKSKSEISCAQITSLMHDLTSVLVNSCGSGEANFQTCAHRINVLSLTNAGNDNQNKVDKELLCEMSNLK